MTISQDALLSSLLFLLPGFIAVGAVVLPFKWLNPPDLSRSTFIILALSLSVPLNWLFSLVATLAPAWLRPLADVPRLTSTGLNERELLGMSLLYAFAGLLGLLVSVIATWNRNRKWKSDGICIRPSRDGVWDEVLKSRKKVPWVVAVLEKQAYYGQLHRYTTTDEDPHIFISRVQVLPLDETTGLPQFSQGIEPPMDGILLKLDTLAALWFVT